MTTDRSPRSENHDQVHWEALARYVAGESSDAERAEMGRWIAADPANAELLAGVERIWSRAGRVAAAAPVDVEGALASVLARMDEPEVRELVPRGSARGRGGWWRNVLVAASLVGVAALGLLWRPVRNGTDAGPAAQQLVFTTAVGARDSVRLPDGTRVVLGPGTQLALAPEYGKSARELDLRGEALFDVTHDEARPFTVRSGGATVRDLGTRFAVHGDSVEGGGVQVVVTGGSVLLRPPRSATSSGDTGLVLTRGDRASVNADGRIAVQRDAATDDDLAWTRGRLVFRDAPLSQVRADVRRWFGVELRLADATLAERHLTSDFRSDDTPAHVVRVIELALGDVKAERSGTTNVFVLRRAPDGAAR
jgi:transmembrane sensor